MYSTIDLLLAFSWLVSAAMMLALADKDSVFDVAAEKKIESNILTTVSAISSRHCTMKCLAAVNCTACNWHEASRTCELLGTHATPVAAPGYTALTRFCKLTAEGEEFQGSLSVTNGVSSCLYWANCCDHVNCPTGFIDLSPENYCRNPDRDSHGPWCCTDDHSGFGYCDVPFC